MGGRVYGVSEQVVLLEMKAFSVVPGRSMDVMLEDLLLGAGVKTSIYVQGF